jgi:hypothetical protein
MVLLGLLEGEHLGDELSQVIEIIEARAAAGLDVLDPAAGRPLSEVAVGELHHEGA